MVIMLSTPKGKKRAQVIIKAAQTAFLKYGYEATTVAIINNLSGGSKSSIYDIFGNKEGLFKAVVENIVMNILTDLEADLPECCLEKALEQFGYMYYKVILSKNAIDSYRLAIAESKKHPEVGEMVYQFGMQRSYRFLVERLSMHPDLQGLADSVVEAIVNQFIASLRGQLFLKTILLNDIVSADAKDKAIKEAIDFTMAYVNFLRKA